MDEILAYAKSKNIGVIPAINSPGHMDAILTAMSNWGLKTLTLITLVRKVRTDRWFRQPKGSRFHQSPGGQVCGLLQRQDEIFNIGLDEYANDATDNTWLAGLQASKHWPDYPDKGYEKFIQYANDLAAIIEKNTKDETNGIQRRYLLQWRYILRNPLIRISLYPEGGWNSYDGFVKIPIWTNLHQILNTSDAWYYVSAGIRLDLADTISIKDLKDFQVSDWCCSKMMGLRFPSLVGW